LVLYYLEYSIPGFIDDYDNFNSQLLDHFISVVLTTLTFTILIRNLIKTQIKEKKIVEESNHLKTSFLANTSHDLRAPANSILSFSEIILQEDLSQKELERYINIIHSNSQQLLVLINDIFDISIIESRNLIISPRNININAVLEEVYSNFKRDIEVSNKNIELNVHFGLPMTQSIIFADAARITQILTNLLQNAIKYTHDGAIAFGYDKKLDSNELIFFFVKDTGSGIPADKIKDIFTRYVTNIDVTKKVKGTGLGLHITNSLVHLMNGKVWVESEIGKGSQFYFTLPLNSNK
jgi:hypothetical protein